MCGRFALDTIEERLLEAFQISDSLGYVPSWNIAPTQNLLAVRATPNGRGPARLRWGLVPRWAPDPSLGGRMINARSETAAEKPTFREAFALRRCLIPATGFYEWKKTPSHPARPYYFRPARGGVMALAGVWESWKRARGKPALETGAILTCAANDDVRGVHDRMPVILPPHVWDAWIFGADTAAAGQLLRPAEAGTLERVPVATRVNAPSNDDPDLVRAIEEECPDPGLFG